MIRIRSYRTLLQRGIGTRGVGIVAVLMIILVLSLMGGVVTKLVATGAVSKTNDLVRERANALIYAGFEYALKRIDDDVDPDGDTMNLGNGQFTIAYDNSTGVITSTSDVSAMYGTSNPSFTIQGPTMGGNMDDCLIVNDTGAYMDETAGKSQLRGLTLHNNCNAPNIISGMTVSTNPTGSENVIRIRIETTNAYDDVTGVPLGTLAAFPSPYSIPACTTVDLDLIRIDTVIGYRNWTLNFHMQDGTTKQEFVQFLADNESACLNADLSSAYVGGTGFVRLIGGTLTNSCADPIMITITGAAVSWSPTSPARQISVVRIGGSNLWSGSASSGASLAFSTAVELDAGASATQDYLGFNDDMRGRNYSIVYTMGDGTTATVPVNLYETDMDPCLTADVSGVSIGGGNKKLEGQTWRNTCALRIVVDAVNTSWTGLAADRRLIKITVNGSSVWSGSVSSGTNVNINYVDIPGGSTFPVNQYTFNKTINGACFSHVMTMFDGGTMSVPSYCP